MKTLATHTKAAALAVYKFSAAAGRDPVFVFIVGAFFGIYFTFMSLPPGRAQ